LQLAARVPRLRPPRSAGRLGRAVRFGHVRGQTLDRSRSAGDAGGPAAAVGGRGRDPQRGGARAAALGRRAAAAARRRERARARREPRRSLTLRLPTEEDAFRAHVVLARGEEPRLETWA